MAGPRRRGHIPGVKAAHQNRPITGMISLALGVIVFSGQDAIIKKLAGDYAVTQAVFVRCVVAIPILLVMVHYEVGLRALASRQACMVQVQPGMQVRRQRGAKSLETSDETLDDAEFGA